MIRPTFFYAIHHPEVLAIVGHKTTELDTCSEATLTVLLVDDNPSYRKQLSRLIGKACPTSVMYEAEDMIEALRLAERFRPRLALVDVVLGDEDGSCVHNDSRQFHPSLEWC